VTPDQARSIIGWLDGAERQRDGDTGTSYRVILPESLIRALREHLQEHFAAEQPDGPDEWKEMWQEACRRAEDEVTDEPDLLLRFDRASDWAITLRALANQLRGACKKCKGYGQRAYASTATWRGGMGAGAITTDVCDVCWGTGLKDDHGPDLRKMEAERRKLEASSSRRWFEERLGVKLAVLRNAFPTIAIKLRRMRGLDFHASRTAELLASTLEEMVGQQIKKF
jgi:hypothetical protein